MDMLKLQISDDQLTAQLQVAPEIVAVVRAERLEEYILRFVQERGVQSNAIDHDELRSLLEQLQNLNPAQDNTPLEIPIARGIPAQDGGDTLLRWHRDIRIQAGREDQQGRVNYKERGYVQVVDRGTLICELHKPTPGSEGTTIFGDPIPPKPGKIQHRIAYDGHSIDAVPFDDRVEYRAGRRGWIRYHKNRLSIARELQIKGDIDVSTGNIRSVGDVEISGSVAEGFRVITDGTLKIGGDISAGAIVSCGNLELAGTCRGRVISVNNMLAKRLEHCHIRAGGTVTVQYVFQSRIMANRIQATRVRASALKASSILEVGEVERSPGEPSQLIIDLHFGLHHFLNDLSCELSIMDIQALGQETQLAKLHEEIEKRNPQASRKDIQNLLAEKPPVQELRTAITELRAREQHFRSRLQECFEQRDGRIAVTRVHEGTQIRIYDRTTDIQHVHDNLQIAYAESSPADEGSS